MEAAAEYHKIDAARMCQSDFSGRRKYDSD